MSDLNSRGQSLYERLSNLRTALEIAAKELKWDKCLRLEGQIMAYESMWESLMRWGLLTDEL